MSNQDFGRDSSPSAASDAERTARAGDKNQNIRDAANQAFSRASDMARDATEQAKHAATATASTVTQNVKDLLDRQIGGGADLAGHFANSVRLAADDLAKESPMVAGFVRSFANTVDGYAEGLQEQTCRPAGADRFGFHEAGTGIGFWACRSRRLFRLPHDEKLPTDGVAADTTWPARPLPT